MISQQLDPFVSLNRRKAVALINETLRDAGPYTHAAAVRLLSDLQAANEATVRLMPDGSTLLMMWAIPGISSSGPANLLLDWRDQALAALAAADRPKGGRT